MKKPYLELPFFYSLKWVSINSWKYYGTSLCTYSQEHKAKEHLINVRNIT